MNMKRKLAGFSACALVLSSLTVPVAHAASADFKDIDSHWAKSSIERWAGYDIVNGFGNNQFKPEDTMTRAQMAQILSKTLGLTATATTNPFTDVSDSDWFKDAILKCSAAGIMKGTSDTTANPNAQISRQDAVTMMGRALGIEADGTSTTFDDNSSIGSWAVGFVNAMAKRGIVNGRSEGVFAPGGDIKRGEIVTILDRAITTYVNTANTEVTATGKGITLIAAPGVTVKGEAEDILVAPAAAGTTKLDGVKVSGAVTMQAADGTLVLGGKTTAAKLNVPALATGAKITIEKDASVAAMNTAADNVAVDGSGKITDMTVAAGKGVTVAGSVKVDKITNNSADPVKKGNTTVAANTTWAGTTTVVGGGGGGGGRDHYTDPDPDPTTATSTDSTQDFVAAAQNTITITKKDGTTVKTVQGVMVEAKKATGTEPGLTTLGNVEIVNDTAEEITLNLNDATAGNMVIRAAKASSIEITGKADADTIATLTIDAPNADVTTDVGVGTANIEAIKPSTYKPRKPHTRINMKGAGHIEADNTTIGTVEISAPAGSVQISGNVTNDMEVQVKSAAEVLLKAIANALKVTSSNQKANITVDTTNTTVTGQVGELKATNDITLEGATVTTLTADNNVELKDSTVAKATTTAADATVTGDAKSKVGTLDVKGNVDVGVNVDMLTPTGATESKVTVTGENTVVKSVTTEKSVTLAGDGKVTSVDVKPTASGTVAIKKAQNADVKVDNVTQLVGTDSTGTDATVTNDFGKTAAKKYDMPEPKFTESETLTPLGTINGLKTSMAYQVNGEEKAVTSEEALTVEEAGTYLVWVKETTDGDVTILASEPARIIVPAHNKVTSATINGSTIIGQILTAVPNPEADNVKMHYAWTVGVDGIPDEAALVKDAQGNVVPNKLKLVENMAGQTITVTITNYNDATGATSVETAKVTADMAEYNVALKDAKAALAGTMIAANSDNVPTGVNYVTQTQYDDLDKAINAEIGVPNTKNVEDATTALKKATETFNEQKAGQPGTGGLNAATTRLDAIVKEANKLLANKQSTDGNGLDISLAQNYTGGDKWYAAADAEALKTALAANVDTTSVDDIVKKITDISDKMTAFSAKLKDLAPLDTADLNAAVVAAQAAYDAVKDVDEATDATQVAAGKPFITTGAKATYETAIATANTALKADPTTQKAINAALTALNTANGAFATAQKTGTKTEPVESNTSKLTVTLTGAEGTVSVKDVKGENGVYEVSKDTDAIIVVDFAAAVKSVTYTIGSDTAATAELTSTNMKTEIPVSKDKLANDVTVAIAATPAEGGEGGGDTGDEFTVSWTAKVGTTEGDDAPAGAITVKNGDAVVTDTTTFKAATELTVTANAVEGKTYELVSVDGKNAEVENFNKVTVSKDKTSFAVVVAEVQAQKFAITKGTTEGVELSVKVDTTEATEAAAGAEVTVTATSETKLVTGINVTLTDEANAPEGVTAPTATKSETDENTWTFDMPAAAVTVTATAINAPVVSGVELHDHSNGDVKIDGADVTATAVAPTVEGADYTIKLTREGADKTIPMHMNANSAMGNWVGFALKHGENPDATTYTSNVTITRSSVSFTDTNADTSSTQTRFDSTITTTDDSVLGSYYFDLGTAVSTNKQLYVVITWGTGDNATTEKILVDASDLTTSNNVPVAKDSIDALMKPQNNMVASSVTYSATDKKYTITLAADTGKTITSGIPSDLSTGNPFSATAVAGEMNSIADENLTAFGVCALTPNFFKGLVADSAQFILEQDNTALKMFLGDTRVTAYKQDGTKVDNANATNHTDVDKGIKNWYYNNSDIDYYFCILPGATVIINAYAVKDGTTLSGDSDTVTQDTLQNTSRGDLLATYEITAPTTDFSTLNKSNGSWADTDITFTPST